jgi:hypothetical protein
VLRNRPAAGHYRGLADPPSTFSIQRRSRSSATLMGFRALCPSQLCSGGDLAIAFRRVFSTSVVTLPRAVEPRATRDVFDVRHRCRGPAGVIDGHGPIFFKLRLLGFGPTGQPFSSIAAAPPRLGYEGAASIHEPFLPWACPLSGLESVEPRIATSGSYPLVGFVFAAVGGLRNGVRCFRTVTPPIPPATQRRPSAS